MAKQTINIGTSENSNNGDPLRTAFQKINENFDELYDTETVGSDPTNLGNSLIPKTSNVYNLGSEDLKWEEGYINQIYAKDWIDLGGKKITLDADGNFVFPGILNATVRVTQDIQGDIFADDSTKVFDSATGELTGDLKGSVFATDSTMLVDAVDGVIAGTLTGNWINSGNTFNVLGEGLDVTTGSSIFTISDPGLAFTNNYNSDSVALSLGSGSVAMSGTGNLSIGMNSIAASLSNNFALAAANSISITAGIDFTLSAQTITIGGELNASGNFTGSVFADDSTLLIDGVSGTIPGYISVNELKSIVADSENFAEFKIAIEAL